MFLQLPGDQTCEFACVFVRMLEMPSVQSSGILPAFVSASVRRVGLQRRARSCLPSLCAPRASVFALQGVPQPEGLSGLCRVGGYRGVAGRTNLQGGGVERGRELSWWEVCGCGCSEQRVWGPSLLHSSFRPDSRCLKRSMTVLLCDNQSPPSSQRRNKKTSELCVWMGKRNRSTLYSGHRTPVSQSL
ncbi:hypothetical protein NQZ68_025104 [Dissostichus eleginoides]|nr:hypothetical protein NQZ68_025104 [Dissostichus eleginoides]